MAIRGLIITAFMLNAVLSNGYAQGQGETNEAQSHLEGAQSSYYPLEIIIRPPRKVTTSGYYENAIIQTMHGLEYRFSGYYIGDMHKRIIDGRMVYDVWQHERDLLRHNVNFNAGLVSYPRFEERLAHELVYGNEIGARMGGEYKNMSFLEIAYSFNVDPTPPPAGFGGSGIYGETIFNTDYSYSDMMFGSISLLKNSDSPVIK